MIRSCMMLGMALGLAASAAARAVSVDPAAEPVMADPLVLHQEQKSSAQPDPDCLRATGSRIVAARNQRLRRDARRASGTGVAPVAECSHGSGRVYTRGDIERTGAIDLADALRMLDPGIR